MSNLFEQTDQMLKVHYQDNQLFNSDVVKSYEYYQDKLFQIVNEADKERVTESLFQSIKSQIFNGYFMIKELLQNVTIDDEWFTQSKGMIAQQIPEMLLKATNNDIEGIITHTPLKTMASWLVIEYEGIYPLLMDISLNTACIGAKWALIDEAEKRGVTLYQPQHHGKLGYIDDVTYIYPSSYIVCEVSNETSELWSIIYSGYNGYDKLSEVTILKSVNQTGLERYYMNINIKNRFSTIEHQNLIDDLAVRFMEINKLDRSQLILAASSVEEFYIINNNFEYNTL